MAAGSATLRRLCRGCRGVGIWQALGPADADLKLLLLIQGEWLVQLGHIVQQRLKRPGAWWTPDNAERMLAHRINRANNRWEPYWDDYIMQAA